MRRFHSYGPVNAKLHFCVPRTELVEQCFESLIGHPEEGGHYFTIWGPRQTGKTWLMRQAEQEILKQYPDQFTVYRFSLGNLRGMSFTPSESSSIELPRAFCDVLEGALPKRPQITYWKEFLALFSGVGIDD